MRMNPRKIALLEKLARLKADRELKKFAAFNAHVTAARTRVDSFQTALQQSYSSDSPMTLAEARAANAQASRSARQLLQADAELARMLPRFEEVRKRASREFGRAEALYDIASRASRPK